MRLDGAPSLTECGLLMLVGSGVHQWTNHTLNLFMDASAHHYQAALLRGRIRSPFFVPRAAVLWCNYPPVRTIMVQAVAITPLSF